jgi:hypothetical protein
MWQRGIGNARTPFTYERKNAEIERRAQNAQEAVQAVSRGGGAQRGRGRGRDRGRGRGRGGGEVQEVPSGAYIQFQA